MSRSERKAQKADTKKHNVFEDIPEILDDIPELRTIAAKEIAAAKLAREAKAKNPEINKKKDTPGFK